VLAAHQNQRSILGPPAAINAPPDQATPPRTANGLRRRTLFFAIANPEVGS
jgi:hypothetical protein